MSDTPKCLSFFFVIFVGFTSFTQSYQKSLKYGVSSKRIRYSYILHEDFLKHKIKSYRTCNPTVPKISESNGVFLEQVSTISAASSLVVDGS